MAPQALTLPKLAWRINAEHKAVEDGLRTGLDHARAAGELLLQARELCPHGDWQDWLEGNVRCSYRTCAGYMQLARGWEELTAKVRPVALLGLRDALEELADGDQGEEPSAAVGAEAGDPDDAGDQARDDALATIATQALAGLSPEQQAEVLKKGEERLREETAPLERPDEEERLVQRILRNLQKARKPALRHPRGTHVADLIDQAIEEAKRLREG